MVDGSTSMSDMSTRLVEEEMFHTTAAAASALSPLLRDISWLLERETGIPVLQRGKDKRVPYSINPDALEVFQEIKQGIGIIAVDLEVRVKKKKQPPTKKQNQIPKARETAENYFVDAIAPAGITYLETRLRTLINNEAFGINRYTNQARDITRLDPDHEYSSTELSELGIDGSYRSEVKSFGSFWFGTSALQTRNEGNDRYFRVEPTIRDSLLAKCQERRQLAEGAPLDIAATEQEFTLIASSVNSFLGGKESMPKIGHWSLLTAACVHQSIDLLPEHIQQHPQVKVRIEQLTQYIEEFLFIWNISPETHPIENYGAIQPMGDIEMLAGILVDIQGDVTGLGRGAFAKLGYLTEEFKTNPRRARRIMKADLEHIKAVLDAHGITDVLDISRSIRVARLSPEQIKQIQELFFIE